MPVYYDKTKRRYRYEFDRLIAGQRQRVTKILPAEWSRDSAEAYAQEQDAKLYAVATGALKQEPMISAAVLLYITEHLPTLKARVITTRELAHCTEAIKGRRMNELPAVAAKYAKDNADRLAPGTIRNRMAYLRAACRWAWKNRELGSADPASRMVLPSIKNERHTYITEVELLSITQHIKSEQARAVCLVAFYSGMRLAEILRANPTATGWLLEDTKNGERRIVPIHLNTRSLVKLWPVGISGRAVQRYWSIAREAAGFDHVHFHDLRHSAASAMVNAGADLYAVGSILGHKSHASTKRYSHLNADTLADTVGLIGKKRVGKS